MFAYYSRILTSCCVLSFILVWGCGSAPTLDTRDPTVPSGVDLSGNWQLRDNGNGRKGAGEAGSGEPLILMTQSQRQQRARRQRSSSGASAHVFLETGESLKVTQTHYGMFISYDRSIVEEYTFGENRLITIGPIEARRVSGWEAGAFIVETLDDTSTILFESWRLQDDGAVLVRDIRISQGDKDSFSHQQVFDRQ